MNAERILIAAECVGDGRWFVEKATRRLRARGVRAQDRREPGRPVPHSEGLRERRGRLADGGEGGLPLRPGEPCGAEANLAKLLAADASWEAANAALQTFGGYGFDAEYGVERKFRETRLYQVAPISTNLILSYIAEHVLGLPRSF